MKHDCETCPKSGSCNIESDLNWARNALKEGGLDGLVKAMRDRVPPVPPDDYEASAKLGAMFSAGIIAVTEVLGAAGARKLNLALLDGASPNEEGFFQAIQRATFRIAAEEEINRFKTTLKVLSMSYLQETLVDVRRITPDAEDDIEDDIEGVEFDTTRSLH